MRALARETKMRLGESGFGRGCVARRAAGGRPRRLGPEAAPALVRRGCVLVTHTAARPTRVCVCA